MVVVTAPVQVTAALPCAVAVDEDRVVCVGDRARSGTVTGPFGPVSVKVPDLSAPAEGSKDTVIAHDEPAVSEHDEGLTDQTSCPAVIAAVTGIASPDAQTVRGTCAAVAELVATVVGATPTGSCDVMEAHDGSIGASDESPEMNSSAADPV